ncbi:histidine phosphatase family protein [Mesorhizobium composti]|uniref:Histidine phosphatase family protein n=2 Tax=Ollibium composti TaxID=2675109 RepID=A0ABY2Q6J6_9HYPH|nr:histidine phosphatase family protein [Mesorhizobium composti]
MRARLTLICSGVTPAARHGAFPADEALDDRMPGMTVALKPLLARADRILTGPELRARQTAEALGLVAAPSETLRDQDFGRWTGKDIAEVGQAEPQALAAWLGDPNAVPGDGESFSAVMGRVAGWLDDLRGAAGHTVAVTHAAVIRAAILAVIGAPAACFARIDVTPLSLTDLRGDGRRWTLRQQA